MKAFPSKSQIRELVRAALREDLGSRGDVTARATVPAKAVSRARIFSKERGILCGVEMAREVFRQLDPGMKIMIVVKDGQRVRAGQTVMTLRGNTRAILSGERTALNLIQQLSGVATLARTFVDKARRAAHRRVDILDTRKTTPTLRIFEKYAVFCGGGTNHRMGLHDLVLIKDNHLAALAREVANPVAEAVRRARRMWPRLQVELECDTLDQVRQGVEVGADIILLDNMKPPQLRRAVKMVQGRARTEASGGVSLKTVEAIARTGVDSISVGGLTHSAPALDFSLEILPGE